MRNRHPRTSATLVFMACLLLVSVAIGRRLGEEALFGPTERQNPPAAILATPLPEPTESDDPELSKDWKRLQVVSVPTDPAFPDPRMTHPPEPTPSPRPTPSPSPTPRDQLLYTSPPLPLPLITHGPDEAIP